MNCSSARDHASNGAAFAALFDDGDISAYAGDDSSADLALCNYLVHWTAKDAARMERLFDRSALGRRDKWKDRPDYRERTIKKAIDDYQGTYNASSSANDSGESSRQFSFSNCVPTTNSEGKTQLAPRSAAKMFAYLKEKMGGWPKRVGEMLFVADSRYRPVYLQSSAQLFGAIDGESKVFWAKGANMITQERFYEYSRKFGAEQFKAIETLPHSPRMRETFYMHPALGNGTGSYLDQLIAFFCPATEYDLELILAALMTVFWGGPAGLRPAFRIEGPEDDGPKLAGRGAGKSTLPVVIGAVAGGMVELEEGESFPDFKTRLLSNEEGRKRVVRIDNLKTLRLSWGALEGFITNPMISGHAMYRGEGQRPNTLTVFITVNGGSLSKDMAQRSIPIRLARPTYDAGWFERVVEFIAKHHWEIVSEIISRLEQEPGMIQTKSRWSLWERDVLSKCSEFEKCQSQIAKHVEVIDADDDDAYEIELMFEKKLLDRKHNPHAENIKIPTAEAAAWFSEYHGKKLDPSTSTSLLRTKPLSRLRYKRKTWERFWIWLKSENEVEPEKALVDLRPASPWSMTTL